MAIEIEDEWWPQAVPDNVEMGPGSHLYSSWAFLHFHSRRQPGLSIGRETGIYMGTMFDVGLDGSVSIGSCGAIAGPVISTRVSVTIGDHALISYGVTIADSPLAHPLASPDDVNRSTFVGHPKDVVIADNVWIGARAVVLGGARIGTGAVVGAAAVVDFEVPPYAIVAGSPSRVIGTVKERS